MLNYIEQCSNYQQLFVKIYNQVQGMLKALKKNLIGKPLTLINTFVLILNFNV